MDADGGIQEMCLRNFDIGLRFPLPMMVLLTCHRGVVSFVLAFSSSRIFIRFSLVFYISAPRLYYKLYSLCYLVLEIFRKYAPRDTKSTNKNKMFFCDGHLLFDPLYYDH